MTRAEIWIGAAAAAATLAAGIGGAFIGGKLANDSAKNVFDQQTQQQRDQDARAARASARLLLTELRDVHDRVSVAAEDACWWRGDYAINVSYQDLKQLAAGAPTGLWEDLASIWDLHGRLDQELVAGFDWVGGQPSADMDVAANMLHALEDVIPKLSRFAGLGPKPLRVTQGKLAAYRRTGTAPVSDARPSSCNDRAAR